jgi:hypothetical protein
MVVSDETADRTKILFQEETREMGEDRRREG